MNFNKLIQLVFLILLMGCAKIPTGKWVNDEELVVKKSIQAGLPEEIALSAKREYTKYLALKNREYITNVGDETVSRQFKPISSKNIQEISSLNSRNFFAIQIISDNFENNSFDRVQLDPESRIFIFEEHNGKELLIEYLVLRHKNRIVDLYGIEAVWIPFQEK